MWVAYATDAAGRLAVFALDARLSAALLAAGRPHSVLPLSSATHMPTEEATVVNLLQPPLGFPREASGMPDETAG